MEGQLFKKYKVVLSTVQTAILSGADCGQNNCLFLLLQYNREVVTYPSCAVWIIFHSEGEKEQLLPDWTGCFKWKKHKHTGNLMRNCKW